MITPVNNRLIVKEIIKENVTESGLILSGDAIKTTFFRAEVLRVSGKMDLDLAPGDVVLAIINRGLPIGEVDGELILQEEFIVAVER